MNIGSITVTTASDYAAADQLARSVLRSIDAELHDNLELKGRAKSDEERAAIDAVIEELKTKREKAIDNYVRLQDDLMTQFTS